MNSLYNVILKPVVSEKSIRLQSKHEYTFMVSPQATKIDIKNAIRLMYGVTPLSVHKIPVRPKTRMLGRRVMQKRSAGVKAIVSLSEPLDVMKFGETPKKKTARKTTKKSS